MAGLKNSGLRGPSIGGLLASLRKGKKDEREGSMRTFALVAGTSFAVGLVGAGYALIPKDKDANAAQPRPGDAGPLPGGASNQTPMAASLVLGDSPRATQTPAPATDAAAAAYAAAVRLIESGETARGLADLRRTAEGGHAPAQFYLAKLYENGEAGLTRDVTEARRWTERAAASGDRKAMHNLALFYFSGDGGAKNMTTAAQWFRRAADQGLVDSQYNLGRLYEEGFGVTTNPAEAYKWYLIAGRAGDTEARTSADRIRRQLTTEAAAAAQRSAAAFRSQSPAPSARAQPGAAMETSEVVTAQRALSRLGYYRGPTDGVASPALQRAIAAWQREQGITASGTINGDTLARLAAAAG
jgi:localization factor PodJL